MERDLHMDMVSNNTVDVGAAFVATIHITSNNI